jgi:hypothetical protein
MRHIRAPASRGFITADASRRFSHGLPFVAEVAGSGGFKKNGWRLKLYAMSVTRYRYARAVG